MYTPAHFSLTDDAEISRLTAANPLATLVAHTTTGLSANHIPLLHDGGGYIGHVARTNDLHETLPPNAPVLAIFTAADGYISPNWYPSKAQTHKAVPTWNYQAVHIHGHLEFLHADVDKRRILNMLTQHFERLTNGSNGWRMGDAPAEFLRAMLDNIVALRLHVTRIEGKSKLNQNRARADIDSVADQLDARGNTALAHAMRAAVPD